LKVPISGLPAARIIATIVMMMVVMMERAVAFGGRFHIVKRTLY